MKIDIGKLIDEWSILKLKVERIGDEYSKEKIKEYEETIAILPKKYPQIDWCQFQSILISINSYIWQLEAGLKGEKEHLPNPDYLFDEHNNSVLRKFGLTVLIIRNFNNLRVQIKNIINNITGDAYQDIRKDHLNN